MLNGDSEEKRNPGRSLAPIIAILAFTIVMTVVALTLHSLLTSKDDTPDRTAEDVPAPERIRAELERGAALQQKRKFADAYKVFSGILEQVKNHPSGEIFDRPELELYCADAAARMGDRATAQRHFQNASGGTGALLEAFRISMEKTLREAETAGQGVKNE